MKIVVILVLLLIFYSLGSALFYLLKGKDGGDHVVKALTFRIALSFGLFILLFIAFGMGWIKPHGF